MNPTTLPSDKTHKEALHEWIHLREDIDNCKNELKQDHMIEDICELERMILKTTPGDLDDAIHLLKFLGMSHFQRHDIPKTDDQTIAKVTMMLEGVR